MRAARRFPRCPAAIAAALMLCSGAAALAQDATGGRPPLVQPDSAAARVVRMVYKGEFAYVRIEAAEAQASPGLHPVAVAPELLRGSLAALRVGKAADEPLFSDAELAEIVPPLTRALAELQPNQDLAFAVAGRHGGWTPLAARVVTTGRMFRSAAGLQLIVGLAQRSFESQYRATGYLIPFEPGRRAEVVDRTAAITGMPPGAGAARPDWVTLTLAPAPAAATAPGPAAATAAPAAPAAAAAVTPAAAAVPAAPATAPAAAAAPAAARSRDSAFYEEQEARLRGLKRLRDGGLITEEEFQQKRKQVLDQL
ncbi:MAG: SHOCT domain-containing protein [Burkholderiaceae bacterium]|nr:SHOCT domain-containing protein [Burkholderiaceae bacterium]